MAVNGSSTPCAMGRLAQLGEQEADPLGPLVLQHATQRFEPFGGFQRIGIGLRGNRVNL